MCAALNSGAFISDWFCVGILRVFLLRPAVGPIAGTRCFERLLYLNLFGISAPIVALGLGDLPGSDPAGVLGADVSNKLKYFCGS